MVKSLKEKTISGLFWSFTEKFAKYGMTFIIGIILARLLSPREFGLVAMITVFIAISQSILDSGFSQALIRKKNCSQDEYSTAFYYNILLGVFMYLILYSFSATISDFYNEPKLISLIRVLGIILIIKSFGLIQQTILIKELNFQLLTKITIIASFISGVVGIFLAYNGWGVWSLVWKTILLELFMVLFLWIWNRWRPKLIFNISSLKELFSFGSYLMLSSLLNTLSKNIYQLFIGKYFSAAVLGYYTRADEFKRMPSQNLEAIINRVSYPALSSIQDNEQKLKIGYKKLVRNTMLITFILMIGLAAISEPLILTLIGEDWLISATYLQLLCFIGMLHPLHALNLNVLKVKGRSDIFFKLEILKKILIVPAIVIGVYFGIIFMILAKILNSLIAYIINSYYSSKLINYSVKEQLRDIVPSFIIALIMGAGVYLFGEMLTIKPVVLLCLQIILGVVIALGILEIIQYEPYKDIKKIASEMFKTKINKNENMKGSL